MRRTWRPCRSCDRRRPMHRRRPCMESALAMASAQAVAPVQGHGIGVGHGLGVGHEWWRRNWWRPWGQRRPCMASAWRRRRGGACRAWRRRRPWRSAQATAPIGPCADSAHPWRSPRPELCGWWFGPNVGGDQVWAYHPSRSASTPPASEWNVPHDGQIDPTFSVSVCKSSETAAAKAPAKRAEPREAAEEPPPKDRRGEGGGRRAAASPAAGASPTGSRREKSKAGAVSWEGRGGGRDAVSGRWGRG